MGSTPCCGDLALNPGAFGKQLYIETVAVKTKCISQETSTLHKNPQENWERRGVLSGEEHASRLSGAKP